MLKHGSSVQSQAVVLPTNHEIFTLTLNDEIDGLELVRLFLGKDFVRWRYLGGVVAGPLTRQFKLVGVNYCDNLYDVRGKLDAHGDIPQGMWLQSFRQAYPTSTSKRGPIAIADPSWLNPDGFLVFPLLDHVGKGWFTSFGWSGYDRDGSWRWLVEVSSGRERDKRRNRDILDDHQSREH